MSKSAINFNQTSWLKSYLGTNTGIKKAKNDLEKTI